MDSQNSIREFADNTLICNFTIPGQPATKKNSSRIIWANKRPRVIPSKQYVAYEKHCQQYCEAIWKLQNKEPIDFGIAIRIKVWLSKWQVPDHVGILQSLGDIFQHWNIITDDKYIHWTDNDYENKIVEHWLGGVDKTNPRIEVWIYRYRHPIEDYYAQRKPVAKRAASTTVKKKTTTAKTSTTKEQKAKKAISKLKSSKQRRSKTNNG